MIGGGKRTEQDYQRQSINMNASLVYFVGVSI